ncbi:hypothetical protein ABZV31_19750 [Streptomyces sp. NPDC005202]|uniref:hypothetical protein n=1 Tax=Streptomyces sp. NPDC005202 TaxID=3157021 RepID=UPI0033B108E2
MISTRRIVAAVGLAASVTGLAALPASAADAGAPPADRFSLAGLFDSLAASDTPDEHQGNISRISQHWPDSGASTT